VAQNAWDRPEVDVIVVKGEQNDGLFLRGKNIKAGLEFDLFTVERSALLADGTADPTFSNNFGLAFYQSDVVSNDRRRSPVGPPRDTRSGSGSTIPRAPPTAAST
jgi:hypothetical protein